MITRVPRHFRAETAGEDFRRRPIPGGEASAAVGPLCSMR
jgi:hypothetical protein